MRKISSVTRRQKLEEEIGQTRPFDSAQAEATMNVLRTADVLRHRFAEILEPHGLSGQQYNVLRILRGARPDPLETMEIVDRMLEKTPGITRMLDRLEENGLVERRRRPEDRRCLLRSITPKGLELLAVLDEPIADSHRRALAMLDGEQVETLTELLTAIREDIG